MRRGTESVIEVVVDHSLNERAGVERETLEVVRKRKRKVVAKTGTPRGHYAKNNTQGPGVRHLTFEL